MTRVSLFTLLAVGLLLGGCGKTEETPTAPGATRKVLIGFIGKAQSNQVFQAAHAGARDAARDLAAKYKVQIDLDIRTPVDEDAQKQAEAIDALVRAGAAGIAVACSEANTLTPAINRAVEKGVVVVTFDSDAPRSKRLCYYGTDDATCGQMVMRELAGAMRGRGTIAILAGNQSAPNLQARVAGVRAALGEFPDIKELNDGNGVFYHKETPEEAANALQQAQRQNPSIRGWALVGGWPLFVKGALKWPPGSVRVVSVDALPAQLPYLKDNSVEVLLAQDCYGWGTRSLELLLDKIVLDKAPPSERVIDPLTRVTKANADEFAKKWEKWLAQ